AEQQDVGLGQLHGLVARALTAALNPLVVVVHRDGESLLGLVLTDDVGVEELVDLPRLRQAVPLDAVRLGELFLDDLVAEVDALVADVHTWAGDELLYLLLALPAERALQQVATVSDACHPVSPLHGAAPPGHSSRFTGNALRFAMAGVAGMSAMPSTACYFAVPACGGRWTNQTPLAAQEGRGEALPA